MTTSNKVGILAALEANRDRMLAQYSAPDADMGKTYGPGKWTVRQLLAHVADCEFINLWRFLRAAAEPGSSVEVFEENDWQDRLDYSNRPVDVSRDVFAGARKMLIHHVKTLPEERLQTTCKHAEKGDVPGWLWARLTTGHCEHHVAQIEAARTGGPWVKSQSPDAKLYGATPAPSA